MDDSPEKLLLQFWSDHMSEQLDDTLVFAREPQDQYQVPPYVCIDVRLQRGASTNTGGYSDGELTFDLFHTDWRTGLHIVTVLKQQLEAVTALSGTGIRLDNFQLESGSDLREPDGVRHFVHTYRLRIHH